MNRKNAEADFSSAFVFSNKRSTDQQANPITPDQLFREQSKVKNGRKMPESIEMLIKYINLIYFLIYY
jgi:hypothetical protein